MFLMQIITIFILSVYYYSAAGNSMRLPCFWFGEKYGVLPAFGDFTGTHRIKPKKGDQVYVCAGKVIRKF